MTDIASVMHEAMNAENRRRELAAQAPGLGSLVSLPQPPSGPGIGLSSVPGLEVAGEGYDTTPDFSAAVQKAYGETRPVYADSLVGGVGFQAGRSEPAIRSHIQDSYVVSKTLSATQGFSQDSYVVVSPPSTRPSLWARLTGKLRHH